MEMKSFTITIPDDKENIFVEMMKSISFVKTIETDSRIYIPEEQQEIVRSRIKQMEEYPESCLSWEDIERKIKRWTLCSPKIISLQFITG